MDDILSDLSTNGRVVDYLKDHITFAKSNEPHILPLRIQLKQLAMFDQELLIVLYRKDNLVGKYEFSAWK